MTFDPVREALRQSARQIVQTAASRMTDDLKRDAPVLTGELRRKTGVELSGQTQSEVRAEAVIDVDYAEPVTQGARPHVIRPRNKKALSFYWPKAGAVVAFRSVNHPGNKANPFFQNVVNRWRDYLQSAVNAD